MLKLLNLSVLYYPAGILLAIELRVDESKEGREDGST
jgi:hypothetical protein